MIATPKSSFKLFFIYPSGFSVVFLSSDYYSYHLLIRMSVLFLKDLQSRGFYPFGKKVSLLERRLRREDRNIFANATTTNIIQSFLAKDYGNPLSIVSTLMVF